MTEYEKLEAGSAKEDKKARERRARFFSSILLALLFAVITGTSVYTAIKCVLYNFPSTLNVYTKLAATTFMVLGPLLANVELALLNSNVEKFLKPRGIFIPTLHVHEVRCLQYISNVVFFWLVAFLLFL